jgi:hypothetical protein
MRPYNLVDIPTYQSFEKPTISIFRVFYVEERLSPICLHYFTSQKEVIFTCIDFTYLLHGAESFLRS